MSEEVKMKNCKFCGKSLPEEAIFCYYCNRELLTRPERPSVAKPAGKINWMVVGVVGIVVLAIIVMIIT